MVINLRGTGGSGKSTIVRAVMERFPQKLPFHIPSRKQPFSYLLRGTLQNGDVMVGVPPLRVLGHYETACGGCDTITSPDLVYQHANSAVDLGENLLYEGIIIGDDVTRCVDLSKKAPLKVIGLNTSMDVCLSSIQSRRDARGDVRPLSSKNTLSRAERLKKIMARLKDANVDTVWMSREQALEACLLAFGVSE